jgi:AcrR family transcriptional regulator
MKINKAANIHRTDPRQIKRIKTISRISAELFSAKGYLETSMDDIAEASRLTKGGIYYYFHSKEDILYSICSTYMDLRLGDLKESLNGIEDGNERVRTIVLHLVDHSIAYHDIGKILLSESHKLSPKHLKLIRARENRYHEIVSGVMADLLGEAARKETVTAITYAFFGMLEWIFLRPNPRGNMKPEELSQLIFELFTGGARNLVLSSPPTERGSWGLNG